MQDPDSPQKISEETSENHKDLDQDNSFTNWTWILWIIAHTVVYPFALMIGLVAIHIFSLPLSIAPWRRKVNRG